MKNLFSLVKLFFKHSATNVQFKFSYVCNRIFHQNTFKINLFEIRFGRRIENYDSNFFLF